MCIRDSLAALYEGWMVPVAVLLSLPVAALGAYLGVWGCGCLLYTSSLFHFPNIKDTFLEAQDENAMPHRALHNIL